MFTTPYLKKCQEVIKTFRHPERGDIGCHVFFLRDHAPLIDFPVRNSYPLTKMP
jgi:hypothetical protein